MFPEMCRHISIGIRSEAAAFSWAVVEGSLETPIMLSLGKEICPQSLEADEPACLHHLKTRFEFQIQKFSPTTAGIRTIEPIAPGGSSNSAKRRLRLEGVLLLSCHGFCIAATCGTFANLTRRIGCKSAKLLLESDQYKAIDWQAYDKSKREAILMACSMLPGE
jgi:hypothetical protein